MVPNFSFSQALDLLKDGQRLQRAGWNGKGMYLFRVVQWTYVGRDEWGKEVLPFIAMKTADDKIVPWLCSQTDMLANDWQVVDA
jgi:hypothetical protein